MILGTIQQKDYKSVGFREKFLSGWVFTTNQHFIPCPSTPKQENLISEQRCKKSQSQSNQFLQSSVSFRAQRAQTITYKFSVSQKGSKKGQEKQRNNNFYGGFVQKMSNKYTAAYKKRLSSLDVLNVDELNVTSYKNFKIRSSSKNSKSIKNDAKKTNFNHTVRCNDKVLAFSTFDKALKQKLPKISKDSALQKIKNPKIKLNYRQDIQKYLQQATESKAIRKNSISAWQNQLDSNS